jgi:glycosyltransferase involved in cell wall biosynthesis
MANQELSIVIPAKNEGKGLTVTLEMLNLFVGSLKEIIVVVEDIADKSYEYANKARISSNVELKILVNEFQRGVTGSICTGIRTAKGEFVMIFPADEINPIFQIEDFVFALHGGCDFVSGTRYAKGGKRLGVGSLSGNFLSRSVSILFRICTMGKITDPTTGLKAFRRSSWEMAQIYSTIGWSYPMELQLAYLKKGRLFTEVPIISVDRTLDGQSSYRFGSWAWNYMRVLQKMLFRRIRN